MWGLFTKKRVSQGVSLQQYANEFLKIDRDGFVFNINVNYTCVAPTKFDNLALTSDLTFPYPVRLEQAFFAPYGFIGGSGFRTTLDPSQSALIEILNGTGSQVVSGFDPIGQFGGVYNNAFGFSDGQSVIIGAGQLKSVRDLNLIFTKLNVRVIISKPSAAGGTGFATGDIILMNVILKFKRP